MATARTGAFLLAAIVASLLFVAYAEPNAVLPSEAWDYVNVDPVNGANIFWWFYGAPAQIRDSAPFVIFLQGGPGASSLMADFCEVGPVNACDGAPVRARPSSWLNHTNMMFVDQPVGTGFSYVENPKGYTTNEQQIANELLAVLQSVLLRIPQLRNNALWVFAESYGGKMASYFGNAIKDAIAAGTLKTNFKGVALGDSWISPQDCVSSYGDFMTAISHFDSTQAAKIDTYAAAVKVALQKGEYMKATNLWGEQQQQLETFAAGVNIYNFLEQDPSNYDYLTTYVNTVVKQKLKIIPANVTWQLESGTVFNYLAEDFMKSGVAQVENLLNAGYKVAIYSGQLDIIVDVLCTERWVASMNNWPSLHSWLAAAKSPFTINGHLGGFRKQHRNLDFWWIMKAGHMVPHDNPAAALHMLQMILAE